MTDERIAQENQFLEQTGYTLVEFAQSQYEAEARRGVVLVPAEVGLNSSAIELRYLTIDTLTDANLLGVDTEASIQVGLTQAIDQYDPEQQFVLVFLYSLNASIYVLHFSDFN